MITFFIANEKMAYYKIIRKISGKKRSNAGSNYQLILGLKSSKIIFLEMSFQLDARTKFFACFIT